MGKGILLNTIRNVSDNRHYGHQERCYCKTEQQLSLIIQLHHGGHALKKV